MKKQVTFLSFLFVALIFIATDIFSQTFENGEIAVSLSGAGRVRIYKDLLTTPRQIDRSSILVGTGPDAVFGYNQDAENLEPVVTITNPQLSDFEIYGAADNSYNDPPLPPNVISKANIYGWLTGGFTLVKFTIINTETDAMDAVIGMEIIPQIEGTYGLETIEWLDGNKIISIYRVGDASYVGYKLLSADITSLSMIDWYTGYDGVDSDLWGWITTNNIESIFDAGGDGSVVFFSKAPVNIPPGDSTVMWVGISVGNDENEMVANMLLAEGKFGAITSLKENNVFTPSFYELKQNYPNPFNPSTIIQFSVPQTEFVSLKVFDVLGNEVANLINREVAAGTYNFNFNANSLSSGIYFYQLTTGNYYETKKMNLIK